MSDSCTTGLQRYWYGASISVFVRSDATAILGQLSTNCDFTVLSTQRDSWLAQIALLQAELTGVAGTIFFEFNIPRMGRRIDVVLVIGAVIFAIEFKVSSITEAEGVTSQYLTNGSSVSAHINF